MVKFSVEERIVARERKQNREEKRKQAAAKGKKLNAKKEKRDL
jgi:hypothetical protein